MKVSKIVCDRCGAEIKEHPIRIFPEVVDRESGDILVGTVRASWDGELLNYDFCDECTEKIIQFAKTKPEAPVMIVNEPTEKEMDALVEAIKKEPVIILPAAESPIVEVVKDAPISKTQKPTVKDLILQGVPKKEVIKITGCNGSSYDQIKYTLKKKGMLPQQQNQDEPKKEVKTYQCSKVMSKCIYASGNSLNRICDYIGITGHRRGCKPEECTKFIAK